MATTTPRSSSGKNASSIDNEDAEFRSSKKLREAEPQDPARIAMCIAIRKALSKDRLPVDKIGDDGVVVVLTVPDDDWAPIARDEWGNFVRPGVHTVDGTREVFWHDQCWLNWTVAGGAANRKSVSRSEKVPEAVATGHHCVGIAVDPALLPEDLVQAADYSLMLGLPGVEGIVELTEELCGSRPLERLSETEAGSLTPRLLRLARRQSQSADEYILKLRELILKQSRKVERRVAASPRNAPTLDRMHGMDAAVSWGRMVARDLDAFRLGQLGAEGLERGCLISGPPGSGKTTFVRALAATCRVPMIEGSYAQWLATGTGHQGDLLRSMRKSFSDAQEKAPSILFLDEVDAFPDRSSVNHHFAEWTVQIVNALLAEIDGVQSRDAVLVIGACNHPHLLDPALTRSGRLDRHIRIELPGQEDLRLILGEHLGLDLSGVSLSGVALALEGCSGADCERYVRGARRTAREAGRPMVLGDLMDEVTGKEELDGADRYIVAVHEAGHAVAVNEFFPGALTAVTIRGGERSAGKTVWKSGDIQLCARTIRRLLITVLAGRAAEEIVVGFPSANAGGGNKACDLGVATEIAIASVRAYGLDAASGLVWTGIPETVSLRPTLDGDQRLASRVRDILADAYSDAVDLIRRRRGAVIRVTDALVEKIVLDAKEVRCLAAAGASPNGDQPL